MTDIFPEVDAPVDGGENIFPEDIPQPIEEQSPTQKTRTALITAVASTELRGLSSLELQQELVSSIQSTSEAINAGYESSVRESISLKRNMEIEQTLHNGVAELESGDVPDMATPIQDLLAFNETMANRNPEYDAEIKFGENAQMMAMSDEVQAPIEFETISDSLADYVARQEALKKLRDKILIKLEHQGVKGVAADTVDFVMAAFVPGNESTALLGNVPLTEEQKAAVGKLNFGRESYVEGMQLLHGMSQEEFFKFLPILERNMLENATDISVNKFLIEEQIASILGEPEQDIGYRNFIAWFDAADVTISMGALAKTMIKVGASTSPAALMGRTGNREEAVALTLGEIDLGAEGVVSVAVGAPRKAEGTDEVVSKLAGTPDSAKEAMPKTMSPFRELTVGLGADAVRALDAQVEAVNDIIDGFIPANLLDPAEVSRAIKDTLEKVRPQLNGENVQDLRFTLKRTGGIQKDPSLEIIIPSKRGLGGYTTKEGAQRAAKRRGFKDTHVVQDDSGQHFIALEARIDSSDFIVPTSFSEMKEVGPISRFFNWRNPLNTTSKQAREGAIASEFTATRLHEEVVKPLAQRVQSLPKKSYKALDKILTKGMVTKKEFTASELDELFNVQLGRNANEAEQAAYYSVLQLNRLEHALNNEKLFKELDSLGVGQVKVRAKTGIRELDNSGATGTIVQSAPESPVFNLREGKLVRGGSKSIKKDDNIVKLQRPIETANGEVIEYVSGAAKDIHVTDLNPIQLGYTPGGHLQYSGHNFVKQVNIKKVMVDGREYTYVMPPRTYVASQTVGGAAKWAENMNALGKLFKRHVDGEDVADEIAGLLPESGYRTIGELERGVARNEINFDTPFEAVKDGVNPDANPILEGMSTQGAIDLAGDGADTAEQTRQVVSRGLGGGRRGEHLLKSPVNDIAMLVSPLDTLDTMVSRSMRSNAWHAYRVDQMERWAATAKKYLIEEPAQTTYSMFAHGQYKKGTPPEIINKLEAERLSLNTILNHKTPAMKEVDGWWSRVLETVRDEGKAEKLVGAEEGDALLTAKTRRTKAIDFFDKDPLTALRGAAFQLKLGLYDPGQVFLQIQASAAALTIDPSAGGRALTEVGALRLALMKDSADLGNLSAFNLIKKITNRDPKEFEELFEAVKRAGFHHISGDHNLMDYRSHAGGMLKKNAAVFFTETERVNRLFAFSMAVERYRRANKGASILTDAALRSITDDAAMLTMDMVSASKRQYQKGVLAVPTQFLSYMANMAESVLPQALGGSDRLTSAEKLRLGLGQAALYGAGGIPLGHELLDYIEAKHMDATGEKPDPAIMEEYRHGLLDMMLTKMFGIETAMSTRAGTGYGVTQFIDKLIGADAGASSFIDVLGGPVGSISAGIARQLNGLARIVTTPKMTAEMYSQVTADARNEFLKQVSSYKRGHLAYIAAAHRRLETGGGTVLELTDKPVSAALMALAGVPTRKQFEYYRAAAMSHTDKEFIKEVTKSIRYNIQAYIDNPEDIVTRKQIIGQYLNLLPFNEIEPVMRNAWRGIDPDNVEMFINKTDESHENLERSK